MVKAVVLAISVLLVASCSVVQPDSSQLSGGVSSASETLMFWLEQDKINQLTPEQLKQLPGAAIYAQLGEQPIATLVLAEQINRTGRVERRWRSAKEALITRNGRITRSEGMPHNLMFVANLNADPLGCYQQQLRDSAAAPHCVRTWQSFLDYEISNQRVERIHIQSRFNWSVDQNIATPLRGKRKTRELVEDVHTQSGLTWQNRYWIEYHSGDIIQSKQHFGIGDHRDSGTLMLREARY